MGSSSIYYSYIFSIYDLPNVYELYILPKRPATICRVLPRCAALYSYVMLFCRGRWKVP